MSKAKYPSWMGAADKKAARKAAEQKHLHREYAKAMMNYGKAVKEETPASKEHQQSHWKEK